MSQQSNIAVDLVSVNSVNSVSSASYKKSFRAKSKSIVKSIQSSKLSLADTCSHCSQPFLEDDDDTCCCDCWIVWKNGCGRLPYASFLAAAMILIGLIISHVAIITSVDSIDGAFKMIDSYQGSYLTLRSTILYTTKAVIYSFYGFLSFFAFVAFMASGKNRDCLVQIKCLKHNLLAFIIVCMVILAIFFAFCLVLCSVLVLPFTIGKLAAVACTQVVNLYQEATDAIPDDISEYIPFEELTKKCLDVSFLGAEKNVICESDTIKQFCMYMNTVANQTLMLLLSMITTTAGIAIGLTALGANFAYVKSVRHIKRRIETPKIDISVEDLSSSTSKKSIQLKSIETFYSRTLPSFKPEKPRHSYPKYPDVPAIATQDYDSSTGNLSVNTEVRF